MLTSERLIGAVPVQNSIATAFHGFMWRITFYPASHSLILALCTLHFAVLAVFEAT